MFPSFLCWIGSLSCFALYGFCIALSLSPYIFLEHFQRQRTEEEEERLNKKKDKEKSRVEVDIEVSWWIADLKTDQLNAFRVNSKRDTLE